MWSGQVLEGLQPGRTASFLLPTSPGTAGAASVFQNLPQNRDQVSLRLRGLDFKSLGDQFMAAARSSSLLPSGHQEFSTPSLLVILPPLP